MEKILIYRVLIYHFVLIIFVKFESQVLVMRIFIENILFLEYIHEQ